MFLIRIMRKIKTKKIVIKFFFSLFLGLFFLSPVAQAANIFLSPSSGEYLVNKNLTVSILVSSTDQAINAVSGVLSFPTDKLEVTSIAKGSLIGLWVQKPSFSNQKGTVNFEGVILNPGYQGGNKGVLSVNFRTRAAGAASLSLGNVQLLANDGVGTNLMKSVGSAKLTIKAEEIKEPETPPPTETVTGAALGIVSANQSDSTKWYNNNTAKFSWKETSGVSAVKLTLVASGEAKGAGKTYAPPIWERELPDLADGTYDFYLQPKYGATWGPESSFKVNIDTTAPDKLSFDRSDKRTVVVSAVDATSGIEKYVLHFLDGNTAEITPATDSESTTYTLPDNLVGSEGGSLVAFDRAGNSTTLEIIAAPVVAITGAGPQLVDWPERLKSGALLAVKGQSNPSAHVMIYVEKNGIVNNYETVANTLGQFSYVWDKQVEPGVYKLWSKELLDSAGRTGVQGNTVFVTVYAPYLFSLLYAILKYVAVIAAIIVIITLLVVFLLTVYRRVIR